MGTRIAWCAVGGGVVVKRSSVQLVLAFAFLHTSIVARADDQPPARVLAPRVFAQGADAQTTAAFELLLVQEVRRELQDRIVIDRDPGSSACGDPECAAAHAKRLGVDSALLCTLTRIGDEHIAVLMCVDTAAHIVWSQRLAAARPEALGEVAARLGAAAASGRLPKAKSQLARIDGRDGKRRRGEASRGHGPRVAVGGSGDRDCDPRGGNGGANGNGANGGDDGSGDVEPRHSLMTQGPRFGA